MNYFHLFFYFPFFVFLFRRFFGLETFLTLVYMDIYFYAFKRLFLFHELSLLFVWWKSFNFILMSCFLITHFSLLRNNFHSALHTRTKSFFFCLPSPNFSSFFSPSSLQTNLKFMNFSVRSFLSLRKENCLKQSL